MHRFLALAGLCLAVFFAMAGMGMAGVALPERYLEAAGSVRSAGWLASCFAVSYMACQYPAGRLADRFGYRGVLVCGFLLMAASAMVYAFAESTWAIYFGRFLQGAGEAPVWASAPALLGVLYPEVRGRVMGFYNAAFHMGMMMGPLVAGLSLGLDTDGAFMAFGWLCLIAAALAAFTVRRGRVCITHSTRQARAMSFGPLRSLVLAVPMYGGMYGLLVSSLPVHLASRPEVGKTGLGVFLFCVFAGVSVAQCVAGRLSDRFGRGPFMAAGQVAMAIGLTGFLHGPQPLYPAFAAVLGFGLGSFAVASMALVNELCPQGRQGTASGYYFLAWGVGYFAGPLAVNLVGLTPGGLAFAVTCCIAAVWVVVDGPGACR